MAARLAVAAGLEQKPYAPIWLCGYGDHMVWKHRCEDHAFAVEWHGVWL